MKQAIYGLVLYVFLMLPPVASLAESIMTVHMHMQMPLFVIAGMLMAPYLKQRFPGFFSKWNHNGVPGILLFFIIMVYWMLPRAMDEALAYQSVEIFKFISLPFLAGVPLRDSWNKLGSIGQNVILVSFSIISGLMAWLYIFSPTQLCNNYLKVEQITLGWAFLFLGLSIIIYFVQQFFVDKSQYE